MLESWLKNPRVVGVFLAPPCGTASGARSIKLKRKRNAPEPLRSDDHPNGLRNLFFINRIKISQANKLYHLRAQIVRYAVKHNMLVVVENPQFSLFWATTFWVSVAKLYFVTPSFTVVSTEAAARRERCSLTTMLLSINYPSCVRGNPRNIDICLGESHQLDISPLMKKQHIQSSWHAMSPSASFKQ